MIKRTIITSIFLAALGTASNASTLFSTGFEPTVYTVGAVDGQDGWSTPVGDTSRVLIRNDVPKNGAQTLYAASGGAVVGTGAFRDISADLSNGFLAISSGLTAFTSGTRSIWEVNAAYGLGGLIGSLRTSASGTWVMTTGTGVLDTGTGIGGNVSMKFDFATGITTAFKNGSQIGSLGFDSSNSQLTSVAAINLVSVGFDALVVDDFSVDATLAPVPLPAAFGMLCMALLGLIGVGRRYSLTA